ncbi:hypothetical protein D9758_016332 [Tetrapyrgos nigripes]|uniref:Cytochrome P450 n=1 Tax=Tetrapyrgos nigripes TaxID=182062 RepID=A0A8H5C4C5_9AGAR|nr:hypothetical protein D9758_016332 [Tetrapyrgos nigripes]
MSSSSTNTTLNIPVLLASLGILYLFSKLWRAHLEMAKFDGIPAVGPSGLLSSFISGMRYVKNARELIKEGYEKYHGRAFKISIPNSGWMVIATGPELVNDIRKASDEYLSFDEALNEFLQIDYTLGKPHREHLYHVNVVRNAVTRNLSARYSDVRDEIIAAFSEEIPVTDDWTSINAYDTILRIVCRTSNRLFVGLPLCRDPDWIDLNIQFTVRVNSIAAIINLFPDILKPIVGNLLSPTGTATRRAHRHIGHIIQDRLDKQDQYGRDWEDKPNDLVSWLLDENPGGKYRTAEDIAMRLLNTNMAAIHTTFFLLSWFSDTLILHNDICHKFKSPSPASSTTWQSNRTQSSKLSERKSSPSLKNMDGAKFLWATSAKWIVFMKEVTRMVGVGVLVSGRKVMKDFTFSDGTRLPAGSTVCIPVWAMHHDERHYEDPNEFKPFRFSDMRDIEENGNIKHQMITPNSDYFLFGTGRHACPGRFFAVNELKTLLAHTLLTYDVKLEGFSKEVPEPTLFTSAIIPNQKAKVLFRKRIMMD